MPYSLLCGMSPPRRVKYDVSASLILASFSGIPDLFPFHSTS
jgi:hypothetical protein